MESWSLYLHVDWPVLVEWDGQIPELLRSAATGLGMTSNAAGFGATLPLLPLEPWKRSSCSSRNRQQAPTRWRSRGSDHSDHCPQGLSPIFAASYTYVRHLPGIQALRKLQSWSAVHSGIPSLRHRFFGWDISSFFNGNWFAKDFGIQWFDLPRAQLDARTTERSVQKKLVSRARGVSGDVLVEFKHFYTFPCFYIGVFFRINISAWLYDMVMLFGCVARSWSKLRYEWTSYLQLKMNTCLFVCLFRSSHMSNCVWQTPNTTRHCMTLKVSGSNQTQDNCLQLLPPLFAWFFAISSLANSVDTCGESVRGWPKRGTWNWHAQDGLMIFRIFSLTYCISQCLWPTR